MTQCLGAQKARPLSCLCAAFDSFDFLATLDSHAREAICSFVQWYAETSVDDVEWTVQTMQVALRSALEWAAENAAAMPDIFTGLFEKQVGWGDKCHDDIDSFGRGGFCDFQVQHLLAAHSIGQYAVRSTYNPRRSLQAFASVVENDGRTRNGLAFE